MFLSFLIIINRLDKSRNKSIKTSRTHKDIFLKTKPKKQEDKTVFTSVYKKTQNKPIR
jgi:hypothetical protein